jgi:hypothetical protein
MAGGDIQILAHCEVPLLVNIAHIRKGNGLKVLLRPPISTAPRQCAGALDEVPMHLPNSRHHRAAMSDMRLCSICSYGVAQSMLTDALVTHGGQSHE